MPIKQLMTVLDGNPDCDLEIFKRRQSVLSQLHSPGGSSDVSVEVCDFLAVRVRVFQRRWLLMLAFLVDVRQSDVTSSYRAVTSRPVSTGGGHLCRDRYGEVDVDTFSRRACALCFSFLFPRAERVGLAADPLDFRRLVRVNASGGVYGDPIRVRDPDVDFNFTRQVCKVLGN